MSTVIFCKKITVPKCQPYEFVEKEIPQYDNEEYQKYDDTAYIQS